MGAVEVVRGARDPLDRGQQREAQGKAAVRINLDDPLSFPARRWPGSTGYF